MDLGSVVQQFYRKKNKMLSIDPQNTGIRQLQAYMAASVGPRPIAFASTIDADSNPNLSPFSFFNSFGVNPPILVFSPSRRSRDNTTKHTYDNIKAVPEVVINVVTFKMVHQASLASTEYPKGVDEFVKSGFTKLESEKIKPYRVKESPVQFECKVIRVIETGTSGGAGNLVICEILLMHINKQVLATDGTIDQHKIDLVGRLGSSLYCRASGEALFSVPKPLERLGIGIDSLPENVRNSSVLTGNDLGQLGNVEKLPNKNELDRLRTNDKIKSILSLNNHQDELHSFAKEYIEKGEIEFALKILLL